MLLRRGILKCSFFILKRYEGDNQDFFYEVTTIVAAGESVKWWCLLRKNLQFIRVKRKF